MPRRISDVFGVTREALADQGAFDRFIDIDSLLHVDPFLLRRPRIPELRGAYQGFRNHFIDIVRLLSRSHRQDDALYRAAVVRLTFPEPAFVGLGYASDGTRGSGIGAGLAERIAQTASEIIRAGIEDPEIFELVGLFEVGVGADRISDMTVQLIRPHLYQFTQRVVRNLGLPSRTLRYRDEEYQVAQGPGSRRPIVLVPKAMLRDLPVANDWSDVDRVCRDNAVLRRRLNALIGDTWRKATRRVSKRELRAALLQYPAALADLIAQYRSKDAEPYDFERDPAGEFTWYDLAQTAARDFPSDLRRFRPVTAENLHILVMELCENFKRLVEENGLDGTLYNDNGTPRHEKFPQLLFFAVADAHCRANDLELSREPNAGRGPVDFKISAGYRARVTVELKYSHNSKLVRGYQTQLPEYNRAERSTSSIYLIIRTTNADERIRQLRRLRSQRVRAGERAPEIVIVDARRRPSASRL